MKKIPAAIIIGVLLFTVSCASQPVDMGIYNSVNIPEEDLITLHIEGACHIERIDNYILVKQTAIPAWMENVNTDKKIVKLNPGVHTLFTKFNNGYAYSTFSTPVTAKFEKGNMYFLDFDIEKQKVSYHIFLYNNGKKSKEVTGMPMENLIEMDLLYSAYVDSPIKRGESVKLENKKFTLIYNPDGIYTQTDKESGITVKGKYIFKDKVNTDIIDNILGNFFSSTMDISLRKVYLFDADAKIIKKTTSWGRKEQEEVDYEIAHTALVLLYSTGNEVIYQYEKPLELKGTEITFNISEE